MTAKLQENDFEIERIEELRFFGQKEVAASKLINDCFPTDFDGRSYFQNRHHCRFLALHNNRVIGHAAVAYRAIRLGDRICDCVGIAEVAVASTSRRQGVGLRLIEACTNEGVTAHADYALLFGSSPLYEKAGFIDAAENSVSWVEMRGANTTGVVTLTDHHLKVKCLGHQTWDFCVPVDLAGFPF